MHVGTVQQLRRYPVKSMGGESLETAAVGEFGIAGDRVWAVRDAAQGRIRGAKKFPALLFCGTRSLEDPVAGTTHRVAVTLPEGAIHEAGDAALDAGLSDLAGQPVTLDRLRPITDLDSYRAAPPGPDPMCELRHVLALLPDEPIPDFSNSPKPRGFASPPGTYQDAAHIHLLTTSSLASIATHLGEDAPLARFRPNLLIETRGDGFPEQEWCGRQLRIGSVVLEVQVPTVRCAMTTHAQPGLAASPKVMRTLVRATQQNFGIYARVVQPGVFSAGDAVELVD